MIKTIGAAALVAATVFASVPASAQYAGASGTGDAAAQNQRSTVGVGLQTGSGGYGYRYGWAPGYAPYYSGRSVFVTPGYGYGYGGPMTPYDPY